MKFTIKLFELNRQLQEVSGIANAASASGQEDISQNLFLSLRNNNLQLKATDYRIELMANIPVLDVEAEGEVLVSASKLREALKNLDQKSAVVFNHDEVNQKLVLTAENTVFEIRTLPGADFPSFEVDEVEQSFSIKQNVLKTLIDKSVFCVPNDDFREYLKGLRLEIADSLLSVFASDAHRLAALDFSLDKPQNKSLGVILNKRCALQLSKILLPNSDVPVELQFTKNAFIVVCNGYKLSSKLILCSYPNVRSVIPSNILTEIRMPRLLLASFIRRVSVLSSQRFNGVTFTFSNNTVDLYCENSVHEIATAKMSLEYSGSPLEITLNANYVNEILNIISSNDVFFRFGDSLNCILIAPDDTELSDGIQYQYVVSRVVV